MSDFAENFEDLRIWQQARTQAGAVYDCFAEETNGYRDFGFKDQIQRAGISVMNNIAEGFERLSPAEFAYHLNVAKGSCGEVRSMLYLAEDRNYVDAERAAELRTSSAKLSRSIEALARKLREQT